MSIILTFLMAYWLTMLNWTIRIGALAIVPFRRSAAAARTWLLIFFIAPIPALVVYLFIGRPEHSAKRQKLFGKLPDVLRRAVENAEISNDRGLPKLSDDIQPASRLAEALSGLPPLSGNAMELLSDYDDMVDQLVADIDAAVDHVHLEFYIFADDEVGGKVMEALERAVGRGIKCRLLIDALGSISSSRKVQKRMRRAGVDVHRILPLMQRSRSSRIDLRNHRKIAVIDGRIGYTGSQNVVEARISSDLSNRELMARVRGPAVAALQAVFLGDWFLETQEEIGNASAFAFEEDAGDILMQALPSGPDYPSGGVDLFFAKIIHDAREEVVIVTPYFIPNEALVAAIRTAAMRGVSVKLIMSKKSDSRLVKLAQHSYYQRLLEAGVDIRLFDADFLHAKHMRVDDEIVVIGSSNMDQRSFELNAEVSLICYGAKAAGEIKQIEEGYAKNATSVGKEAWTGRWLPVKLCENMARMLSDLL